MKFIAMNLFRSRCFLALALFLVLPVVSAFAETRLPSIFGDRMVIQRDQPIRVWGWDAPGAEVTVSLAGREETAVANAEGRWEVELAALPAMAEGTTMTVAGSSTIQLRDILVGEVWLASGQSNMQWRVADSLGAELAIAAAENPALRMITVPRFGTQERRDDFEGSWTEAVPETVPGFSAVAYYFGERLQRTTGVPVGLIHCSWGGSSAEAWIRRDLLEGDSRFQEEVGRWRDLESTYDYERVQADYRERVAKWEKEVETARAEGRKLPARPGMPANVMAGQHRPGNLYAGMLHPLLGFGMRGVIWYQGENNAVDAVRAEGYRELFPLLIQNWRDDWGRGDFSFYWVQLANFRESNPEPAESDWALLRESQTLTMDGMANVGQAVAIDLGEANDIHPRNKREVADRLARWALAKDYGVEMNHRSPQFREMERRGNRLELRFDHVGSGLRTWDVGKPVGFAIAGSDGVYVWAEAAIAGDSVIEVWSETVPEPVSVRYAWADNPDCNVYSREGLPLTPFRSGE